MLTEVHRQAADNPIIALSMQVREGGRLEGGDLWRKPGHPSRSALGAATVTRADQLLVGTNKSRRAFNRRMRELLGFSHEMPEVGEKLVCLRNDKKKGLLNGGTFIVDTLAPMRNQKLKMSVVPEEDRARKAVRISVLPDFFQGTEDTLAPAVRRESDEFDYGYALTVHKAQGSQWDAVVLFDESFAFREHRHRWLYTGLTRAAERIVVVVD